MRVWIGNLPLEATADDVKELLVKYGFPEPTGMEPVAGDGTRPGMFVDFEGVHAEGIRPLVARVDGLFWKGRQIVVTQA